MRDPWVTDVFEQSALAIVVTSLDSVVLDCNAAFERLSGWSRSDLVGTRISSLWPEQRIDEYREFHDQVRSGVPLHIEGPMLTASGTVVDTGTSWCRLVDEAGEPYALMAAGRDTRERKGIEQELRARLELHQSVADQSTDGVLHVSMTPSWRVLFANQAASRTFGVAAGDDPALLVDRCVGDTAGLAALLRGEEDGHVEVTIEPDPGQPHLLGVTTVRVTDAQGHARYVIASVHDRTAERNRAASLQSALAKEQAATAQLRQMHRVRQLLLSSVSHELRTPLTTAVGVAETLRSRWSVMDQQVADDLIDRLCASTDRLQRLLDDVIDVDRMMGGAPTPRRERADVGALVDGVLAEFPREDRVAVTLERDTGQLFAEIDVVRVRRAIHHLVQNAVEHAGDATRIVVRTSADDQNLRVEIVDDGAGIHEAVVSQVIDVFGQGLSSEDMASPGLGIGLTLASEVARVHGGSLELGPGRDGRGLSATIVLPREVSARPA